MPNREKSIVCDDFARQGSILCLLSIEISIMTDLITTLGTGIVAFIATNIDDIFILTLLFTQIDHRLRHRHIVVGQYLGFSLLLLISILGIASNYLIPSEWIRLLGLVPIVIGLNSLGKSDDEESNDMDSSLSISSEKTGFYQSLLSPETYGVAAITVAIGSDNIGVYLPLFANTTLSHLLLIIGVFLFLVGVWCVIAYQLTRLPAIAPLVSHYGTAWMPCILIALGVFIVKENWLLTLMALASSYLWLIFFGQKETAIAGVENEQA